MRSVKACMEIAKHDYPETELLDWMYFINAETKEELEMVSMKNPYIKKHIKIWKKSAQMRKRLEYEAREKAIRDHNYFLRMSKQTGWDEGLKEGLECGMKQGLEQGLEQGIKALIKTCRDLGVKKDDTLLRIEQMFSITQEKASMYLEKFWKQ